MQITLCRIAGKYHFHLIVKGLSALLLKIDYDGLMILGGKKTPPLVPKFTKPALHPCD